MADTQAVQGTGTVATTSPVTVFMDGADTVCPAVNQATDPIGVGTRVNVDVLDPQPPTITSVVQ